MFMPTFTTHRYGWTLEPKSSSPMLSAWAVSLLLGVTIPTTITATGKDVDTSRFIGHGGHIMNISRYIFIFWGSAGISFVDSVQKPSFLTLILYKAPKL